MNKQYTPKDLELPDDEPMVIIRKSFLWICDGDKYAAAALNMYVHWTKWIMKHRPVAQEINRQLKKQGRKPSQDTSLVLYRKQKDLVKDLLNFCNEKRLRQANELLESKGLLKIDDTPRSNLDHVLKYELQIDVFKKYMEEWRKYRGEEDLEDETEMVEVALEAVSSEADNSPSRNGQKSAPKRTIVGSEADNSPSLNKNIDNLRDNQIDDDERKNAASQRKANATTGQEATHSSMHSSLSASKNSSFSSSPEEKPKEVEFSPEEQRIYDFGKKDIFKAKPPRKTAKLKSECAELVEHIKTQKQFDSLLTFVRSLPYIKGQIHIKNLVNGLNGWLQLQEQPTSSETHQAPTSTSRNQQPVYVIDQDANERRKAALRAQAVI
jgi:hypothetical protein